MNLIDGILQGTTPTFVITIPEEIQVSTITAAELTFRQGRTIWIYHLADLIVDAEENKINKPFTEQETLALDPKVMLNWQLRIRTADGIFGTKEKAIDVLNLISEEAIS